jgi:homoserine kinase
MLLRLPPGRGLGSSATAVVGGALIANTLLGKPLNGTELLDVAVGCEPGGHADNAAAALLGGIVVTGARAGNGAIESLALPVPPHLRAVLFIPDQPMSTTHGRSLLPTQYDRSDVTFNLSRVALLLAALQSERFDLLNTAMDDRVHQPYREQLFPALGALIAAGHAAGAHGVCLSGGGSSVLALATSHAEQARDALDATARSLGVAGYSVITQISRDGAQAWLISPDDVDRPGFGAPADDMADQEQEANA